MTPKQKAEELIDKFTFEIGNFNAKQCALIAIDEILNFDLKAKNESQFIIERRIEEYWQEVRTELEKL